jgi:hypothetical protein
MPANWSQHHRVPVKGAMQAVIQVLRRPTSGSTAVEWTPATGGVTQGIVPIWEGKARVQSNKDWRARRRSGRGDPMVQHAFRVQVPLRDENGLVPAFDVEDLIRVIEAPNDEDLLRWRMVVRNNSVGSNPFNKNLLCDVDLTWDLGMPGEDGS